MTDGLRMPMELIVIVVTLLAFGCPVQAIVQAYGLDERTVASWRDRAGKHCQQVHHAVIEQGHLDLVHVQADEIRVKARGMVAWMGLAIMVSTRLWLGGVVSCSRDTTLANQLLHQVRACCQAACHLLVCTDGWAAYPGSIKRAFRKIGQTDSGTRARLLGGLVRLVHWHRDQAHRQQAANRGGSADELWGTGTRTGPAQALLTFSPVSVALPNGSTSAENNVRRECFVNSAKSDFS